MSEDEINLVNYIKVIFKQKWLILIIALLALVFGIIFGMRDGKQYKDDLVLQIGQMRIYKDGLPSTFTPEDAFQIKEKVENNLYNESLGGVDTSKITEVEVIVSQDKTTNKQSDILIINATSSDPKELKLYLEKLGDTIVNEHKKEFKKQENYLNEIISTEEDKLEALDRNPNLPALQYLYVEDLSRIDDAEMSLNSIDRTVILRQPSEKVLPQKNNYLIKALMFLVAGLFLGVIVAFIKEFFEKNKDFLKE